MAKIKVSEIRAKFPMYEDLSDDQLLLKVRDKFYPDMSTRDFTARIDYDTDRAKYSPAGDSFWGNLRPAAGAGMASIGRAVGLGGVMERFGLPGTKEEAEQLDQPLNEAAGGTTGRVLGSAAVLAPTAFIPGANTYAGAAGIGGLTGLLTTEGGASDRLKGAAVGTVGGLAGNLLGRGIQSGVGLVKGLIEPFRERGQEAIAGRTIARFATDPQAVLNAQSGQTITGAVPTLAEASRDTGIATLERALGTLPGFSDDLLARSQANTAARLNALDQVAGRAPVPSRVRRLSQIASGTNTAQATAAREAAAGASYSAARRAGVDEGMADALAPQIESLMQRPSMQQAQAVARRLAAEEGINLTDTGSAQGLQYMKQAIDDMIGRLRPEQRNELRLLTQTSSDLKSVLDELVPAIRQADAEFRFNSIPVNRGEIADRLINTTRAAQRDLAGNRPVQANAFANALNDEGRLINQATGRTGNSLEGIMTPTQMARINAVRDELETAANLSRAANGPGSQTAKMLASQNLMRRIAGPLGMPESWLGSAISNQVMRGPQFFMNAAEERIQQSIAQGLLNPAEGRRLLEIAMRIDTAAPSEIGLLTRALGPGLLGYAGAQAANQ